MKESFLHEFFDESDTPSWAIPCQDLGCAPQHVMDFFFFLSVVVDNDEI